MLWSFPTGLLALTTPDSRSEQKRRFPRAAQVPGVPGVCAKAPLPSGGQLLEMHLRDPTSTELSPLDPALR